MINNQLVYFRPAKDVLKEDLLNDIYELNQSNIPALGSIDDLNHLSSLYYFSLFCVCSFNGKELSSFALVMDQNSSYQSVNYKYFKNKFSSFIYLDRIAVAENFQRIGIGTLIYNDVFDISKKSNYPFCCEVNTIPKNHQSLAFHVKNGFDQIDNVAFGEKEVGMMVKLP